MISGNLAPKNRLWKHFFSPRIKISSKLTKRRGILRSQLLRMYPRNHILSGSLWNGLSPSRNVYNHLIRIHAFHVHAFLAPDEIVGEISSERRLQSSGSIPTTPDTPYVVPESPGNASVLKGDGVIPRLLDKNLMGTSVNQHHQVLAWMVWFGWHPWPPRVS